MDTWHHLRGLSEAFLPRNLEKIQFRTIAQNGKFINTIFTFLEHFVWLCKIFALSCEISFHFSLLSCSQSLLCSISHDYADFLHVHAKWKNIVFQLLFVISSISFFWVHFNYLQINSKSQSKLIALLLSTLFVFLNLIHLFCRQFIKIIPWNDSKTL